MDDVSQLGRHLLTREEEVALGRRIKIGDVAAFHEMFVRNVRLVIDVAKRYIFVGSMVGLDLADLVQEGSIGLLTAIRKWDPERGFKFSSYAIWWLRQAIRRSLDNSGLIRVPIHMQEVVRIVNKAILDKLDENGKEPTVEQIVEMTGLETKQVNLGHLSLDNK